MTLLDDVDKVLARVAGDLADHHWSTIAAVEDWLDTNPMPGRHSLFGFPPRPWLQLICDLCGCYDDDHTETQCRTLLDAVPMGPGTFTWCASRAEGHDPSGPRLGPGLEPVPIANPTLEDLAALPILSPAAIGRAMDLVADRVGIARWRLGSVQRSAHGPRHGPARTVEQRAAAVAVIAEPGPVDLAQGDLDVARVTWSADLPPAPPTPDSHEHLLDVIQRDRRWPR